MILQVEAEVVDELTIQFNVATVPTFVLLQVRGIFGQSQLAKYA